MTRKLIAGVAVLTVALAGCAVLKIDVDVYKGPLANDETVQVEQLGAMVIAARPLLEALESECEVCQARGDGSHQAGYQGLTKRIKAVLSLYDDRGNTEVATLLDEADKALQAYDRAYKVLHPDTGTGSVKTNGLGEALASAINGFLAPANGWREQKAIFELAATNGNAEPALANSVKANAAFSGIGTNDLKGLTLANLGANQQFLLLEDVNAVTTILEKAGMTDAEARNAVASQIATAAKSFHLARRGLREMWDLSVRGLELAHQSSWKDAGTKSRALRAAADACAELVNPAYLAGILKANPSSGKLPYTPAQKLRDELREKLGAGFVDSWTNQGSGLLGQHVRTTLADVLRESPEHYLGLRYLDAWFASRPVKEFIENGTLSKSDIKNSDKWLASRAYGLVRGPTEEMAGPEFTARLKADLKVIGSSALGLERGRIEAGLYTVVEKYLEARQGPESATSPAVSAARENMLIALTGFAEKLKFLADNQIVIQSQENESTRPYVMLLQATGNGILTVIDELRQRGRVTRAPVDHARIQQRAVDTARGILASLPAKPNSAAPSAAAGEIAVLRSIAVLAGDAGTQATTAAGCFDGLATSRSALTNALQTASSNATRIVSNAQSWLTNWSNLTNAATAIRTNLTNVATLHAGAMLRCVGEVTSVAHRTKDTATNLLTLAGAAGDTTEILRRGAELMSAADALLEVMKGAQPGLARIPNDSAQIVTNLNLISDAAPNSAPTDSSPFVIAANKVAEWATTVGKENRKWEALTNALQTFTNALHTAGANIAQTVATLQVAAAGRPSAPPVMPEVRSRLLDGVAGATNGLEAIDILLEQMRLLHVAAVASGDTNLAEQVNRGIDQARAYRAGRIGIRPTSAYLRNSYATTAAQEGTATTWRNNLQRTALRSFPLLPDWISAGLKSGRVAKEIDRQHWQNINQVRVSAAVNANYVIVKDDIGNWYVKGFSANPDSMIKAARALGLYAAGPGLAAGLIPESEKDANGTATAKQPAKSPLERQRTVFDERFTSETSTQWTNLNAVTESLANGVRAAISAAGTNLLDAVKTALTNRFDAEVARHIKLPAGETNAAALFLARVGQWANVRDAMAGSIQSQVYVAGKTEAQLQQAVTQTHDAAVAANAVAAAATDAATNSTGTPASVSTAEAAEANARAELLAWNAQRQTATRAVVGTIDAELSGFLRQRIESVRRYETELGVLGQAAQ